MPTEYAYTLSVGDGTRGHRDWRYDELRVSERGNLIHEIERCGAQDVGISRIEASDLEFHWIGESPRFARISVKRSRRLVRAAVPATAGNQDFRVPSLALFPAFRGEGDATEAW
jgi:hypothetical protein